MKHSTENPDLTRLSRDFRAGLRTVVIAAVKAGVRYRLTKNGIMFMGDNGYSFTIHRTESDTRAERNTIARFKRIGFEIPQKGKP